MHATRKQGRRKWELMRAVVATDGDGVRADFDADDYGIRCGAVSTTDGNVKTVVRAVGQSRRAKMSHHTK